MPTKDRKFTLKDYEQLIDDVLTPYFQEQNVTHDLEELLKVNTGQEIPPTPDEEIEQQEVV